MPCGLFLVNYDKLNNRGGRHGDGFSMPLNTQFARPEATLPAYIRASGALRCRFEAAPRGTEAAELSERGGYRMKFPKNHDKRSEVEGVIINTGGGMAGGDHLTIDMALDAGSQVVLTTQSAEKVYRAQGASSRIETTLKLASGARLAWLPQETLLFSGACLERSFEIDVASDAELILFEGLILGRGAMGERMEAGLIRDKWRVRRNGRLVFADQVSLNGEIARHMDRPAIGGGAKAIATVLYIAQDAEARLDAARQALAFSLCESGASAWNGMLIARFTAGDPAALRLSATRFLTEFRTAPLPRVWQC